MARAAARTGCRCRPMSARRSPPICDGGGRRVSGGRCSCARGLRMRRSPPERSPRPSGARADAPGSRSRLAPAAAHNRVRDGRGRGADRADRPSAAASQPAEHRDLRARGHRAAPAARRAVARKERAMSALDEHAQQYLRARRALGVKLERHGRLLPELVAYLESAGASTITRELAISWAKLPVARSPSALGGEAVDRARVRRLPADDRPGDRDPAGGSVRRPLSAPDPVPVVPHGHRSTA